jgi:hypothetical protein
MSSFAYNGFKKNSMKGVIGDLSSAGTTVKVALVTSTYVAAADKDAHEFFSSVTNEVSGSGYTAGGAALANKAVTQVDASDLAKFDADDVTWANATVTARGAVVYKDTGTAATSPLICLIDFTTDKSSSNGNFTIQWDAGGIVTLS